MWHAWLKDRVRKVLLGKPEGKRPLGRQNSNWDGNINMDIQEFNMVVWTVLSWLRIGTGGVHL
jgi:hypothetical protein